ncbi:hypothetical protein QBC47DRAFT_428722 [Echria macrotheca]|uniref:Uncharacterized protein n=1 Tax=Echria macrotheca TaxID=438768 RepID=A0AAJ0BN31_9PEZI|nr:hypothetical protein QBC47DRAFT_428722 [Echria macrotheca]
MLPLYHLLYSLLILPCLILAQIIHDDAPLWVQAGFQNATITPSNSTKVPYNIGGTITVNGFTITVPRNLLVQFPAAWVPWAEFVAHKDKFVGFETLVIGNTINNTPLAAQVILTEFFEGLSSGFIDSINHTDASLQIANGPKLRLADPNAVFSAGYFGAEDDSVARRFMVVDDVSPSITSFSGFPMCIPRNASDPLCPMSNRPVLGATGSRQGTFVAPDQLVMAPFVPGDFITFTGYRSGPDEVVAQSIVAQNVQIMTTGDVVYLRVELALLGIYNPHPAAEVADSRFIGYTSNPLASSFSLYALDIDPCTSLPSPRLLATVGPRGGRNLQHKFEYRNEILDAYTREYLVTAEIAGRPVPHHHVLGGGTGKIVTGTYTQPVNVWVQAEQAIPGVEPIPFDFSRMAFLTRGVGRDVNGRSGGGGGGGGLQETPDGVVVCLGTAANGTRSRTVGGGGDTITGGREVVEKRFGAGGRGRFRVEAVSGAENKASSDEGVVEVAPAEAGRIAEKERVVEEEFLGGTEMDDVEEGMVMRRFRG